MIGDSIDIVRRIRRTIPRRWWNFVATIYEALLGGLADSGAWGYNFYLYAKQQSRVATSTGIFLDLIAFDFIGRNLIRAGLPDDLFRTLILALIFRARVTRAAVINIIAILTGNTPTVFEPWNTIDTGSYGRTPSKTSGQMGYGVGQGGWGNMNLPAIAFMKIKRGKASGVPNVAGYGGFLAGYGTGQGNKMEYIGPLSELTGITDGIIYQTINQTRPTGSAIWVQFQ
jgi:hypothetical protein